MDLSLEVLRLLLVPVRGLAPTVASQLMRLSQVHLATMAPQTSMAPVLGITRSSPPQAFLEARLEVLEASPWVKREPITF